MTIMMPSLHEFNLDNGLSSTREPIRRSTRKADLAFVLRRRQSTGT